MSAAKLSVQEAVVTGERRNLSHAKLLRLLRQRKSHLLQRLPDHVLQRIAESNLNSGLSMAENQKIMKEGDLWDPPWLWFVYEGKVDVKHMKVNLLIATVGPGSLVGEFSAVTGERHVADAFAKDKSVLVKLDVEEIEHLMPENPKFFANLVSERLEMAAFYQELNQGCCNAVSRCSVMMSVRALWEFIVYSSPFGACDVIESQLADAQV
jgi:CRP-like cAMP-binding protein